MSFCIVNTEVFVIWVKSMLMYPQNLGANTRIVILQDVGALDEMIADSFARQR